MNRLFLVAIAGECGLLVLTGMKMSRHYNPFSLLRKEAKKVGVVLPNNRLECLLWIDQIFKDNNMKPSSTLQRAINKIQEEKVKEGV